MSVNGETATGELVVQRAGNDGITVGYLHGLIGTPPAAPILTAGPAAGLAITAPCLPGFSGSPPNPETRTIHDWVFHLSAALDTTGLVGRPMVAASVGAMIATELAAVRPEAFSQLVLIGPLGLWDDGDPIADPFATTLTNQRRMLTVDPTTTAAFFDDPEGMAGDELIDYGVTRYQTRTAGASLVWPLPDRGLAARIHRVTVPTTVIWGAEDAIAPVSYLDRWTDALPNVAAAHTVTDAGHLVDWDQPAAVAELVASAVG